MFLGVSRDFRSRSNGLVNAVLMVHRIHVLFTQEIQFRLIKWHRLAGVGDARHDMTGCCRVQALMLGLSIEIGVQISCR